MSAEHDAATVRVVTPEQYREGYSELRGMLVHRRPFQLVSKTWDGNYVVKEPKA